MSEARTPVVFIHGLWLHATSWNPWLSYFEAAGYAPVAPGWPGDRDTVAQTRRTPGLVADRGVQEVVDHYLAVIAELSQKPIVIGHSFGGLIAEKLLGLDAAAAAIAIDAAQIKGVLPLPIASLKSTLPVFKNPKNIRHAVSLTAEEFRYSFGNALTASESDELHERWTIPAPGRPLFEAAAANFEPHPPTQVNTDNQTRGPLLLVMGGRDHTVPEAITKSTLRQYRHSNAETDLLEFPDRGHSLTIDHGWQAVADACLAWLEGKHHAGALTAPGSNSGVSSRPIT